MKIKNLLKLKISDEYGEVIHKAKIEPKKLDSVIDAIKKKYK